MLTALVFACKINKDNQTKEAASVQEKLVAEEDKQALPDISGTWMWAKTVCCARRPNTTFDTTGTPTFIEFKDNGQFLKTRNNEQLSSGDYVLRYDLNMKMPMLELSNKNQQAIVHFKEDTLVLDYAYMDLQSEFYVRPRR